MPRILVIADAAWVRDEVVGSLSRPGWTITDGIDGRDAVDLAAEDRPDIVVADSQVGSMGAMAVARTLRSEVEAGRLNELRVLVLLDRRADVQQARRALADAWLVKPLVPGALAWTVESLLDSRRTWSEDDLFAALGVVNGVEVDPGPGEAVAPETDTAGEAEAPAPADAGAG